MNRRWLCMNSSWSASYDNRACSTNGSNDMFAGVWPRRREPPLAPDPPGRRGRVRRLWVLGRSGRAVLGVLPLRGADCRRPYDVLVAALPRRLPRRTIGLVRAVRLSSLALRLFGDRPGIDDSANARSPATSCCAKSAARRPRGARRSSCPVCVRALAATGALDGRARRPHMARRPSECRRHPAESRSTTACSTSITGHAPDLGRRRRGLRTCAPPGRARPLRRISARRPRGAASLPLRATGRQHSSHHSRRPLWQARLAACPCFAWLEQNLRRS